MDFRWVAAIALWTLLSGPVLVGLRSSSPARPQATVSLASRALPVICGSSTAGLVMALGLTARGRDSQRRS
jgi:hypothetical protein